jgi:hypothetical protein
MSEGRKEGAMPLKKHATEKTVSLWLPVAFVARFNSYCAARKNAGFRKVTVREIVYEFLTEGMMRHPVGQKKART